MNGSLLLILLVLSAVSCGAAHLLFERQPAVTDITFEIPNNCRIESFEDIHRWVHYEHPKYDYVNLVPTKGTPTLLFTRSDGSVHSIDVTAAALDEISYYVRTAVAPVHTASAVKHSTDRGDDADAPLLSADIP